MASIIKRTYLQKLPDGSTIRRKCRHYTIQYRDAGGRQHRVRGYTDLAATRQKAAELDRALARGETGLIDEFREHKGRALSEHINDWLSDRRAAGRSEKYIDNAERRLAVMREACGWASLHGIEANSFLRWREKAKKKPRYRYAQAEQTSATTLNQYLDTIRAFLNWCVDQKRIASNALAKVDKVEGPKVRKRRGLTDDESQRLLTAAPESRRLIYRVALAIGLRRGELESLCWGDLRLNAIKPFVQLRAEATKARRGDRLPLPATLAEDLRKHRPADVKDNARVFSEVPSIEDWKADLKAAKIPYKDEMGRQVDFHGGTRKTLCTRLHRNGVPLAVAMRMMRHTDARLTMVDYADDSQLAGEDALLPEPLPAMTTAGVAAASAPVG